MAGRRGMAIMTKILEPSYNRTVAVVGVGGTGAWVALGLSKILRPQDNLVLIDGDKYEDKNKARQFYQKNGEYKVHSTTSLLHKTNHNCPIYCKPVMLDKDNISEVLENIEAVFLCVDNNKCRQLVHSWALKQSNVLLVNGGNELTDGNAQIMLVEDSRIVYGCKLDKYHPEFNAKDKKEKKKELSCSSLPEQYSLTNMNTAVAMLNLYFRMIQTLAPIIGVSEVYFDMLSTNHKGVVRA
jgi:tRNA A37 threonylcarbamoyladenosine dehydratase